MRRRQRLEQPLGIRPPASLEGLRGRRERRLRSRTRTGRRSADQEMSTHETGPDETTADATAADGTGVEETGAGDETGTENETKRGHGSFTFRTCPVETFLRTCRVPLGQRISISRALRSAPRPKCTRMSDALA